MVETATPEVTDSGCSGYVAMKSILEPAVNWQVVVKAQVRTTTTASIGGAHR